MPAFGNGLKRLQIAHAGTAASRIFYAAFLMAASACACLAADDLTSAAAPSAAAVSPAASSTASAPAAAPASKSKHLTLGDKPVSIYSSALPVADILQSIARQAGLQIDVDPGVKGTLDLSLKDVPLRSALNVIASTAGLDWESVGSEGTERVQVKPQPKAAAGPAATLLDFKTASTQDSTPTKTDAAKTTQKVDQSTQPTRELKLNNAQMMLVLNGVPHYKANAVLNYWRNRSGNGLRISRPGVPTYVDNRRRGRFTNTTPDVKYYFPDGSVWRGYPFPYQRLKGPTNTQRR